MTIDLAERAVTARGRVRFEAHDAAGRLVHVEEVANAFTDLYAQLLAERCAGITTKGPTFSHIGLGAAGATIERCEAATGWTTTSATITVDAAQYREGTAALKVEVAASTTGSAARPSAVAALDATGGAIELWMRVLLRGRLDLAASQLRIYTSATDGYGASLSAIEAANGVFQDGVWKLVRIPLASFTVASGVPSWTTVTGVGLSLAANASGTGTVWLDDVRIYLAPATTATATGVPNERTKQALSTLSYPSPGVVQMTAYWTAGELAGTFYVVGLYGNGGSTLAAIAPLTYTKLPLYTLTITWTITFGGG